MFVMTISAKGNEELIREELGVNIDAFNNNIASIVTDAGFRRTGEETYEISEDENILGIMLSMGAQIEFDPELLPYITKWESDSEEDGHEDWLPQMVKGFNRLYGKK